MNNQLGSQLHSKASCPVLHLDFHWPILCNNDQCWRKFVRFNGSKKMLIFAIQFLLNLNSLDLNIIMKNKKYTLGENYVVVKYSKKSNKSGLSPFHAHCIWHQVWLHSHQYKVLLGMSQRFSIEYLHLQHEYVTHALFVIHVYLDLPKTFIEYDWIMAVSSFINVSFMLYDSFRYISLPF